MVFVGMQDSIIARVCYCRTTDYRTPVLAHYAKYKYLIRPMYDYERASTWRGSPSLLSGNTTSVRACKACMILHVMPRGQWSNDPHAGRWHVSGCERNAKLGPFPSFSMPRFYCQSQLVWNHLHRFPASRAYIVAARCPGGARPRGDTSQRSCF